MEADKSGADDLTEPEIKAYLDTFKEKLLRVAHEEISFRLIKSGYHRPSLCPKRKVRQDPPVCPRCTALVRPYGELDIKLKEEIWDVNAYLLDPVMEELTELYERLYVFKQAWERR
jgi:hypothetical protein